MSMDYSNMGQSANVSPHEGLIGESPLPAVSAANHFTQMPPRLLVNGGHNKKMEN